MFPYFLLFFVIFCKFLLYCFLFWVMFPYFFLCFVIFLYFVTYDFSFFILVNYCFLFVFINVYFLRPLIRCPLNRLPILIEDNRSQNDQIKNQITHTFSMTVTMIEPKPLLGSIFASGISVRQADSESSALRQCFSSRRF